MKNLWHRNEKNVIISCNSEALLIAFYLIIKLKYTPEIVGIMLKNPW